MTLEPRLAAGTVAGIAAAVAEAAVLRVEQGLAAAQRSRGMAALHSWGRCR